MEGFTLSIIKIEPHSGRTPARKGMFLQSLSTHLFNLIILGVPHGIMTPKVQSPWPFHLWAKLEGRMAMEIVPSYVILSLIYA